MTRAWEEGRAGNAGACDGSAWKEARAGQVWGWFRKDLLPRVIDADTNVVDGDLAEALTFGVMTELDMFCLPSNPARQRQLAAERDDVADLRSSGVLAPAPGGHSS